MEQDEMNYTLSPFHSLVPLGHAIQLIIEILQDVGINFFPSSDYYSHYPKGVKYLNRRPKKVKRFHTLVESFCCCSA